MNIWSRVFCNVILFIFVIISPWWLGASLSLYLFFLFDKYYELIFLGLLYDVLYGIPSGGSPVNRLTFFLSFIFLYIILNSFKRYLRFYV